MADSLSHVHTLDQQYSQTWQLSDVDERIRLYEGLVGRCAIAPVQGMASTRPTPNGVVHGSPTPAATYLGLAHAYEDRFQHTGQLDDLSKAVDICRSILLDIKHTLESDSAPAALLLGIALRHRFEKASQPSDIEEAILVHRGVLAQATDETALHMEALLELGTSLLTYYRSNANPEALSAATSLLQDAVAIDTEHRKKWRVVLYLAEALHISFRLSGNAAEIDKAVDLIKEAFATIPNAHRDAHLVFSLAATISTTRYVAWGHETDLTDWITFSETALALQDHRHPQYIKNLHNTSLAYNSRHRLHKQILDLDRAIEYSRNAVQLCPESSTYRSGVLNGHASNLGTRFELVGDMADIEEAISLQRDVTARCPEHSPYYSTAIFNLGNLLHLKYLSLHQIHELDESILLTRNARQHVASTHINYVLYSERLSEFLAHRFDRLGYIEDYRESVELDDSIHDLANLHGNYAQEYLFARAERLCDHYKRSRKSEFLDKAIQLLRTSPQIQRADGIPTSPKVALLTSKAYRSRFLTKQGPDDADVALKAGHAAVESAPRGLITSIKSSALANLSELYITEGVPYFDIAKSLSYLHESALSVMFVRPLIEVTPVLPLLHGLKLNDNQRLLLLQVYEHLLATVPRVIYLGLDIASRMRTLAEVDSLARGGATQAILLGRLDNAVEVLDHGRAIFWNQSLRTRSDFADLPPALATKISEVAQQLGKHVQDEKPAPSASIDRKVWEAEAAQQRRLGETFEQLIEEARAEPGLERFMLPEKYEVLSMAASRGPVVILIAAELESHAIIIPQPHEPPRHLRLPKMPSATLVALQQQLDASRRNVRTTRGLRRVLKREHPGTTGLRAPTDPCIELWMKAIQPVVHLLGTTHNTSTSRPRMFLCATGAFAQLPLHAAGLNKEAGSNLSDFYVSSYIPNLTTLLNLRRAVQTEGSMAQILLAAVPRPYKGTRLPYSVREINLIEDIVPQGTVSHSACNEDSRLDVSLADRSTTASQILERLPSASILHLACHGEQNAHNALASGFTMSDKTLTVAQIMKLQLPNARLAFLSACETAKGDKSQPDQVVHLAAAMLFVGFKSVVGTMWSMGDVDGPVVASRFYQSLFQDGTGRLNLDLVPYALDEAVGHLRARGLHYCRWAPYVHLGA